MRTALALLALLAALPAGAQKPIPWQEADQHVGEEAVVEGEVVDIHCSPLSCLLAFEPSFNRFTAIVQARNFGALPPEELERRYRGKRVRVRGKIEMREGKPGIAIESPEAIALAATRREERAAAERTVAQAHVDLMERLADVLERVEELTERMADVQERMDTLLAQLEAREMALAAAQADQPEPPPPPSFGEPQPRPGFEALRRVKRGMTRAEVERLVGQPLYVEGGTRGSTTWYYGYGRSVSFNPRGRVESFVGFPNP